MTVGFALRIDPPKMDVPNNRVQSSSLRPQPDARRSAKITTNLHENPNRNLSS